MKKYITPLLTICFLACINSVFGQTIDITMATTAQPNINETFIVTLSTSPQAGAENELIDGYQLNVKFDQTVLEVVSVTSNQTIFDFNTPGNNFDNDTGIILQSGATFQNATSGSFELAQIEFKAIGPSNGSEISLLSTFPPTELTSAGTPLFGTYPLFLVPVNNNPEITITSPLEGADIVRATDISFEATVSDIEDEDGTLNVVWSTGGPADFNGASAIGQFLNPGLQTLTATVTDSNGAEDTATLMVNVLQPELSVISPTEGSVLNSNDVTFDLAPIGIDLSNDHFHFYINPLDPDNLTVEERINTTNTPGEISFTFGAADNIKEGDNTVIVSMARSSHADFAGTRQVIHFIIDSTKPEITLTGDNPMEITLGSSYLEPGATATDTRDGDLTNSIDINATAVDTSVVGSNNVIYTVSDAAGNIAEVIRVVNVLPTLGATAVTKVINRLTVYPNPANTALNILIPENTLVTSMTIYTIDGKRIALLTSIEQQKQISIDVSSYAKGTYLLTTETSQGNTVNRFSVK